MASIGEKLRSARENLNLDLDEVSASTRISRKYLTAMEKDDRSIFPAGFFYRSFVLQYARRIHLDEASISADLEKILSSEAPLPLPGQQGAGDSPLRHITPVVQPRSGLFSTGKVLAPVASLVLVVAACAGLYAWWQNMRHEAPAITISKHMPPVARHTAPPRAPIKSAPPVLQTAAPSGTSPLEAQAQPVAGVSSGDSAVPENAKLSLIVAASETTWVSVSADGHSVFSGLLQANESKKLGAMERAKLVVGNAGGLTVEWNGRPLGSLGRRGQVRVVTFTPSTYTFLDSADSSRHPASNDLAASGV